MKFIFIFFIFFLSTNAFGNVDRLKSKVIHLKAGLQPVGYELKVGQRKSDGQDLVFVPSIESRFAISANIEGLFGLSWGFKQKPTSEERIKKGETDYQDWRLSFPFERFRINLYWVRYEGFYVKNSLDADPSWDSDGPFVRYPQLYTQSTGGSFTWVHSPENFSLVASLDQTDRQTASGGSLLYGLTVNESFFKNSDEIFPSFRQARYGEDGTIIYSRFRTLVFNLGYGYTYVFGNDWFASGVFQLGAGAQTAYLQGTSFVDEKNQATSTIEAIGSFGYNSPHFFSGFKFEANEMRNKGRSIKFSGNLYQIDLYLGTHF